MYRENQDNLYGNTKFQVLSFVYLVAHLFLCLYVLPILLGWIDIVVIIDTNYLVLTILLGFSILATYSYRAYSKKHRPNVKNIRERQEVSNLKE